jgi:DNA replicative helicase MCM subunit Mcm2 (Cdc46/Mcm family)
MGKVSTAKKEARKAPSAKKIVLTCAKCGRDFVAEAKTRPPKHCEACATPSGTWKVIGFEDSPFGKVRVEQKGEKIRKILVE